MSVWDRRKEILYGNGLAGEVNRNKPTPECEVNGTECMLGQLSVSDLFICLQSVRTTIWNVNSTSKVHACKHQNQLHYHSP